MLAQPWMLAGQLLTRHGVRYSLCSTVAISCIFKVVNQLRRT